MKIGILVAMDKEFAQLETLLAEARHESVGCRTFVVGRLGANEVVMHQCGIGKVNAALGTQTMLMRYAPECVVSTGVAGGAQTTLEVQDVVVSTAACYHDVYCGPECGDGQIQGLPERFGASQRLVKVATELSGSTRVVPGLIVTGDWFVDSRDKMSQILSHFPDAMAVDMESAAIAHACHLAGVEFVSFRIISDIPLKDHKAQMYKDFWAQMAENSFGITKEFFEKLKAEN